MTDEAPSEMSGESAREKPNAARKHDWFPAWRAAAMRFESPSRQPASFIRRWTRRCPDCHHFGCKGTPDSQLWTVPDGKS